MTLFPLEDDDIAGIQLEIMDYDDDDFEFDDYDYEDEEPYDGFLYDD